jgi:protein NRD1
MPYLRPIPRKYPFPFGASTFILKDCRQTNANTGLVAAGLDAAQLALLQQLALAQTASSAAPSAPSQLAPHVPAPSGSAVAAPSSYRDKPFNTSLIEGRHDRHHSPERVNAYDDQRDDREASFRGARGGFRGRGSRSRWDDRDRDRYKGRDSYRRRSRSRSPPSRYGGRRDVRPYSPPRRPTLTPMSTGSQEQGNTRDAEKDEFGRDIRPQSPQTDSIPVSNSESMKPSVSAPVDDPVPDPSPAVTSNHERMSLVAANTSSSTTSVFIVSNEVSSTKAGMENFDPKTFDPTSPESWQVLGKMWQVTYGYTPSTEQLMQFVFAAAAGQASVSGQLGINQDGATSSAQAWGGTGRGRGGFNRGRGTFEHGNARNAHEHWTHDSSQTTDAVVLGGTTGPEAEVPGEDDSQMNPASPNRSVGSGGRMQRIGDKWVFVRGLAEITS